MPLYKPEEKDQLHEFAEAPPPPPSVAAGSAAVAGSSVGRASLGAATQGAAAQSTQVSVAAPVCSPIISFLTSSN
jgi:hypothetical protein